MYLVLLVARLLLVGMFAVAGLAKLADRAGSRQALINFGVPTALAAPGGTLLPLVELVVAALLIPPQTAWWGALGALLLLLAFVVGISYNLARGRTPDCHCFGQLHSAPVGWPTLVRNAVLAALAGVVLWQGPTYPGASVVGWLGAVTAGQVVSMVGGLLLLALLLAEGWLLLNLLRQNGRLLLRIEALEERLGAAPAGNSATQPVIGLPVGTPAPSFELVSLDGAPLTLDVLRALGKPVMLVFSDPSCGPCTALLPDLARWQHEYADKLSVVLVTRGSAGANRAKLAEHGLTHVLLQQDREVAQAYQAPGTPTAVIVRADGTIGSPLAPGAEAIVALVARTVAPSAPIPQANGHGTASARPVIPPIGAPAPTFALPDMDGKMINLADFRGRSTLLLFWNPGCGFCQRMLDDLKTWEANPPKGAPGLLVVSTGTAEANRAQGLRAPIVLDQQFASGRQFGATGTPMAVLIDAQGRIASEVAAGGPAVLALANDPHQLKLLPA
jgi:methylamine dehydrogenase accessory protein MauD